MKIRWSHVTSGNVLHGALKKWITANVAKRTEARSRKQRGLKSDEGRPTLHSRNDRSPGGLHRGHKRTAALRSCNFSLLVSLFRDGHQFTHLPCLETFTLPKLKSISVHFSEFSILHIILFFFTRNNWTTPEGPQLLTKSKRETMLPVQSVYHQQLASAERGKMGCSCTLRQQAQRDRGAGRF